VKASFLALYWAIFEVSKKFRMAWWAVTAYTSVAFLATLLASFWNCTKPTHLTNLDDCDATSFQLILNVQVMWCVLNGVGDIMTMILPLGMLRTLHITTAQKLGLIGVTALVFIDIVFDILRTVYTLGATGSGFPDANDVWDICEPAIAVIVCALPVYRGLLTPKKHVTSTSYEELGGAKTSKGSNSRTTTRPYEMDTMRTYDSESATILRIPEEVHAA